MVTTRRGRSLESATPELETPKRRTSALKRHGTSSTSAAQKPKTPFSSTTPATTTVFLEDWWLIKANGKDLGVGGFAARASLGVRAFSSAPVSKRHSGTVLETADGITVTICGLINMSRTHQNGFPSKDLELNMEKILALGLFSMSTNCNNRLVGSAIGFGLLSILIQLLI
ncbi:SANT associated [Parasponia andersonii]|uniref:SANT associated n=1 Tax=Parasponia andersonii TaxID=3476 RepID=A0A2P5DNT5_PARAD|nr:SANT associated [Parasponia andersonii]